jgi:hypothetical protein
VVEATTRPRPLTASSTTTCRSERVSPHENAAHRAAFLCAGVTHGDEEEA